MPTRASACVVPPALSVAEALQASGKAVLTAAVAGYEITARIGLVAPGVFHRLGYHATPICGSFAAGIAASSFG